MKKLLIFILTFCIASLTLTLFGCKKTKVNCSCYDISVRYDDTENTLKGVLDFTYYNDTGNEICELKFNLYGNAFRQEAEYKPVAQSYRAAAYYNGESYGYMRIDGVENCAAWNVGGEDENILSVTLLTPTYPEDNAKISISYTLKLADVNHRTGVTQNTVNLGNFYPVLCYYLDSGFMEIPYYNYGDPFVSECADYTVNLELPPQYTAATSGALKSESVAGDIKKCVYTLDRARDFAMVLSDKFTVESKEVNGTTVSYYYYNDESPSALLNVACESFEYFSKTFGRYPYPTLSLVQTGFCYGGMEYPALVMISDSLQGDTAAYTAVHETAHQWWYGVVGSDQVNNAWQDEGLAEYSALAFFESSGAYPFTRAGIVGSATRSYRAYYSVYNQIFGEADTAMGRRLDEYESEYEYSNIAYNKGVILFDTVRKTVGDEKFFAALKEYYKANSFKIASPDSLVACFLKRGDLEGVFNAFIEGKVVI